jgi:hypothetical protein
MSNRAYSFNLLNGNFALELYVRNGLTANYSLAFPNTPPANGQYLKWDAALQSFVWEIPSVGGGGSVSNVSAVATPASIFNATVNNPTTTPEVVISLDNQTANTVLAAPNSANGEPSFRALVNNDLPNIEASKITGVLAKANIPSGTQATSWQIANGTVLTTDAGGNLIITSNGTDRADLYARNLYISGTIDRETINNVNIGDATITLLSEYTGSTPSTNTAIITNRGSLAQALLQFDESDDTYKAGLGDNLKPLTRTDSGTFTNASISGGLLTITHNLRGTNKDPNVVIKRNDGKQILMGVTYVNENTLTVDFSRVGAITGTWQYTVSE